MKVVNMLKSAGALGRTRWWNDNRANDVLRGLPRWWRKKSIAGTARCATLVGLSVLVAALCLQPSLAVAVKDVPYGEDGSPPDNDAQADTDASNDAILSGVDPHPDAINTATCDYHDTTSPYSATYADFASNLTGPKGNTGLTIQNQVEYHHVGGASVVIIEDGNITQHHWYGC